ncbi:unnamed protein product [Darwinula stevensoni]|uniref:Uncharacterized protein n=1 Tax=Darwinula stevensoni TaxID=69355 RepID=A0A7R9AC01_9CRUS|nr:unnamed protein product [Darwinula stevensoni]CAG0899726.1 unnamed protein product [Darwinula stevensoni]
MNLDSSEADPGEIQVRPAVPGQELRSQRRFSAAIRFLSRPDRPPSYPTFAATRKKEGRARCVPSRRSRASRRRLPARNSCRFRLPSIVPAMGNKDTNEGGELTTNGESPFVGVNDPNRLIDSTWNLTKLALKEIGDVVPLRTYEVPLLKHDLEIPPIGFALPLGKTFFLDDGTLEGLETARRTGNAILRRDGDDYVVEASMEADRLLLNYTAALRFLLFSIERKFSAEFEGIQMDLEIRGNPTSKSFSIGQFDIKNIRDVKMRLGENRKSNSLLTTVVRGMNLFLGWSFYDYLEPLLNNGIRGGIQVGLNLLRSERSS